ncbi:hypothetical protein [Kribbella endophytica]
MTDDRSSRHEVKPTFFRAAQRVERAAQRYNDLAATVGRVVQRAQSNPLTLTMDRATFERRERPEIDMSQISFATSEDQKEVRLLSSEILNHLRTALDYVAYDLAWLDSGKRQQKTSFPMQKNDIKYGDVARKSLPKVTTAHRDLIRTYQPFEGCKWTSDLSELNNHDKHNQLIVVSLTLGFNFNISEENVRPDPTNADQLLIDIREPQIGLMLDDGRDAAELFQNLLREVTKVVNIFRAEINEPTLEFYTTPTPPQT